MKENDLDFEIEEDLVKLKSLPKFLSKQKTVFYVSRNNYSDIVFGIISCYCFTLDIDNTY